MQASTKNVARLAAKGFAVRTAAKQVRAARDEDDLLRLADAVFNLLAVVTAVAILWRELRQHGGDISEAVAEYAP